MHIMLIPIPCAPPAGGDRSEFSGKLHPVAASVVYRMLARHGWRKVAPDTRHPKSDPLVQEEWKKTPRSIGCLAESERGMRTPRTLDVPGRSTLRAHGQNPALLGTLARATCGVQWVRARVRVRLWRCQPCGRSARLDDHSTDEYRQHECLPRSSRRKTSQRIHDHGRRRCKLACMQGFGSAKEHPTAASAALRTGTQSAGARLG